MKYTSLQPDEIRQKVYEVAKEQFLEKGIAGTEMKQLAEIVGIGRTTLYRYYPSIHRLAFLAATEFWDELVLTVIEKDIDESRSGYEILEEMYYEMVERIAIHPREALFFSQFDALFVPGSFPNFSEAKEYTRHIARVLEGMKHLIERGQSDGSIRSDVNVFDRVVSISQVLLGYEQRTALHPEEWRQQGGGIMHWMAQSLLETLKPPKE